YGLPRRAGTRHVRLRVTAGRCALARATVARQRAAVYDPATVRKIRKSATSLSMDATGLLNRYPRCHSPAFPPRTGIVRPTGVVAPRNRTTIRRGRTDHGRAHAARKPPRSRQLRVRPQHRAGSATDPRVPVRKG